MGKFSFTTDLNSTNTFNTDTNGSVSWCAYLNVNKTSTQTAEAPASTRTTNGGRIIADTSTQGDSAITFTMTVSATAPTQDVSYTLNSNVSYDNVIDTSDDETINDKETRNELLLEQPAL